MNANVVIALACLAVANAGLVLPSAKILQGPSSKTTLVGPDGSVISAAARGGQIITEEDPGLVGYSGPVVAGPVLSYHSAPVSAHSASIVAHASPIVAHASPVVAYASPIVAHASPVVAHATHADTVIAGPSGTIATGKSLVAGSVVSTWAAPIAHVVIPEELEGQYVHDYTETLYDDGSYKPHAH